VRRAVAAFAALALCAGSARADERKACVDAADKGQTLRDQGKLVEARESFVACARDACPAIVARQCTAWLSDVDRESATVTFVATDPRGAELVDVEVAIDGVITPGAVEGRAVPINPGVHTIRFSRKGAPDVEKEVVVHAGERARRVEAVLGAAASPVATPTLGAPPPPSSGGGFRFPLLAGFSLGVGAASFAVMGVLVGTTASDVDHLRATCAGSCDPSSVSSANTRIALANVAMGVGILGVATAAVTLAVVNFGHREASKADSVSLRAGAGSLDVLGRF
jgi:hypothetical protein